MKALRSTRVRHVLVQSGGTVAGNAIGAFLPFVVTHLVGTRRDTDAYFLAVGTTLFLVGLFGTVLEGLIVPFAVERRRAGGVDGLRAFVRRTLLQGAVIAVVGTLATGLLMRSLVLPQTSFTPEQRDLTAHFLLLLTPLPALMTISSGLSGTLYSLDRFGIAAWSQGLRAGGGLLAALFLYPTHGLSVVPLGIVLGEAVRVCALGVILRRSLARAGDVGASGTTAVAEKSFWRTASLSMASMVIIGINPVVDKVFGSRVDVGAVTLLELCEKLFYTPFVLLSSGVAVVYGASWAKLTHDVADRDALRQDFWRTQRFVAVFSSAACAALVIAMWVARRPLSEVLHVTDPEQFAWTFTAYAVGLPAALFSNLGVRLIVAFRHTRVLPMFATVALVLNTVLDIVGAYFLGVAGIALAFALHRCASAVLSAIVARRLLAPPRAAPPRRRRLRWRSARPARAAVAVTTACAAVALGVAVVLLGNGVLVVFYLAILPLLLAMPLAWLPATALVAFALLPVRYFPDASLYKTLSPALWVTLVWALRVAFEATTQRRAQVARLPLAVPLLAVWLLVAVANSPDKGTSATWTLCFLILVLLPPLLLRARPLDVTVLVRTWIVLAAVLGGYAVVEAFVLHANPLFDWAYRAAEPTPLVQKWSVYRATTSLGHPLTNGLFFAVGAVLGFTEWQRSRRVGTALLTSLTCLGLVATGSRSALAAAVAGGLVVTLVPAADRARKGGRLPKLLATALALGVLTIGGLATTLGERSGSDEGEASSGARTALFSAGWHVATGAGPFGQGPGLAANAAQSLPKGQRTGSFENSWLELFIASGPLAVLLALALLWSGARRAAARRDAGLAGSLVAFAVCAASFNLFEGNRPALVLFGLLLGFAVTGTARTQAHAVGSTARARLAPGWRSTGRTHPRGAWGP